MTGTPDSAARHAVGWRVQGAQYGDHNNQVNVFGDYHAADPVAWPVLVGRAPLLADAYQERVALRDVIDTALRPCGAPAMVTLVVAGSAGVGKTQLVAAAFDRHRVQADLAVWVTAPSRTSVLASYAAAFARIEPARASGDIIADGQEFMAWLAATDRTWLIVLDDVADPADLAGLWATGRAGRVLVTTRRRDDAMTGHGRARIDVDVYSPDESVAYLSERLASRDLPSHVLDGAGLLSDDLGHLPLALGQAAAVVANDAITCTAYRVMVRDRARTLAEVAPLDPGDGYPQGLAAAWSLAVDRADALPPASLARRVLDLVAVLDPNGIPEAVLIDQAARAYFSATDPVRPAAPSARKGTVTFDDARRALRNLHRLSLITHDPSSEHRTVRIHALTQRASREARDPPQVRAAVKAAADALVEEWPQPDSDPALGQVLRANSTTLADRDPQALWVPDLHPILVQAGDSLGDSGLVAEARDYFVDLAETAAVRLGAEDRNTLTARCDLAWWRGQAGDPAGAVAELERLLPVLERILGTDHLDTLAARSVLAQLRGEAGRPDHAAREFASLLADRSRVLGPDHPKVLATRHDLAKWRGVAGDPAGAAGAFADIVADRTRILGPDHPHTLASRRNLIRWSGEAGKTAEAAVASAALTADYERLFGNDHPYTLVARAHYIEWLGRSGDPSEAALASAGLLADHIKLLGTDHPETLRARQNLAYWEGEAGDPRAAATASDILLSDRLRVLGPDHPDTLTTRANIAYWTGQGGDPAAAVTGFERLLSDRLRVLGPDHPDTLTTRQDLAYWRAEAGDPVGAADASEELLSDRRQKLGPDHPDTLITRGNLAYFQAQAGDIAGALAAFQQLLEHRKRVLGADHPHTLATGHEIALWQERMADTDSG